MKAVVVQMSLKIIQECDEIVKAKYYPNRNKLICMAMRDLLSNRKEFQSSSRIVRMRMNDFACPECGAHMDRAEQEKTEGNYYYCGNYHTVFCRCKRAKEEAPDVVLQFSIGTFGNC